MTKISLDGAWQLYFRKEKTYLEHPDRLADGLEPLEAAVPGNVELDLQRAGLIAEPLFAANIDQLRDYEDCEWWYVRHFTWSEKQTSGDWELIFAGLDTLATVWLNGEEIGSAANMLIEHHFKVSQALRPGENTLAVRLLPVVKEARKYYYDASLMSSDFREECLYIRKAPHMWGWDIFPRAVSAGIWRSVWLEKRPQTAIEQLYFWTKEITPAGAVLGVRYQFRTDEAELAGFSLQFHGECGDASFDYEHITDFLAGGCLIPVPEARLWYPRGAGEPNLYTVTTRLCYRGVPLAERTERIGIRQIALRYSETGKGSWQPPQHSDKPVRVDQPFDPENHFLILLNGEPLFIKGANWVPMDIFHSRDAGRVAKALSFFEDLECNMVRCWGGGVYEDEQFFDICDEKGIMVWQDMSLACSRSPQTPEFAQQMRREVKSVAERIRNHASLAVWCGDNEVDMEFVFDGLAPAHNLLTREVIPQELYRMDPYRCYVPSSPYVSLSLKDDPSPLLSTPEQHLWGTRSYYKNDYFRNHRANFIGETGYHGCPNVTSLRRFFSTNSLWPWKDNDEWQVHSGNHFRRMGVRGDRVELMANQLKYVFGEIPDNLGDFVLASQITQAEAIKTFIETTRCRKWFTSGILWWNMIDGWPEFSEAAVDYYYGKKLVYHYIRRVQQPVCLFLAEPDEDGCLPLIVSNDGRCEVNIRYRLAEIGGAALSEGSFTSPAGQNWQVGYVRNPAGGQKLYLIEWDIDGRTYGNHYLAGKPPFRLEDYRSWLPSIGDLQRPFDAGAVAR